MMRRKKNVLLGVLGVLVGAGVVLGFYELEGGRAGRSGLPELAVLEGGDGGEVLDLPQVGASAAELAAYREEMRERLCALGVRGLMERTRLADFEIVMPWIVEGLGGEELEGFCADFEAYLRDFPVSHTGQLKLRFIGEALTGRLLRVEPERAIDFVTRPPMSRWHYLKQALITEWVWYDAEAFERHCRVHDSLEFRHEGYEALIEWAKEEGDSQAYGRFLLNQAEVLGEGRPVLNVREMSDWLERDPDFALRLALDERFKVEPRAISKLVGTLAVEQVYELWPEVYGLPRGHSDRRGLIMASLERFWQEDLRSMLAFCERYFQEPGVQSALFESWNDVPSEHWEGFFDWLRRKPEVRREFTRNHTGLNELLADIYRERPDWAGELVAEFPELVHLRAHGGRNLMTAELAKEPDEGKIVDWVEAYLPEELRLVTIASYHKSRGDSLSTVELLERMERYGDDPEYADFLDWEISGMRGGELEQLVAWFGADPQRLTYARPLVRLVRRLAENDEQEMAREFILKHDLLDDSEFARNYFSQSRADLEPEEYFRLLDRARLGRRSRMELEDAYLSHLDESDPEGAAEWREKLKSAEEAATDRNLQK